MTEVFDWLKPSPLWQQMALDFRQPDFFRPQLLEFRSDTFMEDFLAAAGMPKPTPFGTAGQPAPPGQPLKLFQPIHGCFYLVCGSLVLPRTRFSGPRGADGRRRNTSSLCCVNWSMALNMPG